jgi:small-conductance mechanosensitive channel
MSSNLTEAMEAQANTLATQSRLLQQICDRMEAQDHHWEALQRSVAANANAIATLTSAVAAADPASIRADLTRELKLELSSQVEYQVTQFQIHTWERIDAVDGALSSRVEALEQVTSSLDAWRPSVDHSTRGIQTSVDALRAEISQLGYRVDHLQPPPPTLRPGILGPYASTVERQPAPTAFVDGPTGHRAAHQRREDGHGYIYTHSLLPPNGTPSGFDAYQH